jgi:hypothetical protein
MGREAVKNGLAVGRTLYLGHGTRATACDLCVFEDSDHMVSEGFTLYCVDPLHLPPAEDSSELSKQTRGAGIALAVRCAIAVASVFMTEPNVSAFSREMGGSARSEMLRVGPDVAFEMVTRYVRLPGRAGIDKVLDPEKPGTNDLLCVFLQEINRQHGPVGFRRTGVMGFDLIVVPSWQETVKAISSAAAKFGW